MANSYDHGEDVRNYFLEGFLKSRELLKTKSEVFYLAGDSVVKPFMDEFVSAKLPKITKVVANEKNGYTIVKFSNDYVSKVKCNNETFDLEKAVAMAIAKYLIGNNGFYKALENATVIKKEEK